MKKLLALLMCLMCLTVSAFAADSYPDKEFNWNLPKASPKFGYILYKSVPFNSSPDVLQTAFQKKMLSVNDKVYVLSLNEIEIDFSKDSIDEAAIYQAKELVKNNHAKAEDIKVYKVDCFDKSYRYPYTTTYVYIKNQLKAIHNTLYLAAQDNPAYPLRALCGDVTYYGRPAIWDDSELGRDRIFIKWEYDYPGKFNDSFNDKTKPCIAAMIQRFDKVDEWGDNVSEYQYTRSYYEREYYDKGYIYCG